MLFVQPFTDDRANCGCASQTATDKNFKTDFAVVIGYQLDPDIVIVDGGTVLSGAAHRDFKFSWQEGKFGMQSRPLSNDFTIGAGILQFIRGDPCELVSGGIANTVAAGLNGMHLHRRQLGKDVGNFLQQRPVQLHILSRADVDITFIIGSGNIG